MLRYFPINFRSSLYVYLYRSIFSLKWDLSESKMQKKTRLKTERVFSRRKESRNLAEDLEFGSVPVKIRRDRRCRRKISSPSIFSASRCRCLSGRCWRIFGMRFTESDPSLASPNSYIVLRLWRAARDPWNPRKGCRHRWRRREGGCTKRHVTHILPTSRGSRAKKASLLLPREGGMIEKLIFQIKSLIRARSRRSRRPIATMEFEQLWEKSLFILRTIQFILVVIEEKRNWIKIL